MFRLFAIIASFGGPSEAFSQLWSHFRVLGVLKTLNKVLASLNLRTSSDVTVESSGFLGQLLDYRPSRRITNDVLINEISPIEISVIIPCFAQAEYLFSAINSVSTSTQRNHECIVIDDGNLSRKHLALLSILHATSPHQMLRIISQENMGLPGARNTGIQLARGKYIKFLDSDDLVLPDGIDRELDLLEASNSSAVLSPYFYWDSSSCQSVKSEPVPNDYIFQSPKGSVVKINLESLISGWEESISIPIHSATFRKSCITEFDERFKSKEDFGFWAAFVRSETSISYLGRATAIYRGHPNQMTKTADFKNGLYFLEVLKSIYDNSRGLDKSLFRNKVRYVLNRYGSGVIGYWKYLSTERFSWLVEIEEI